MSNYIIYKTFTDTLRLGNHKRNAVAELGHRLLKDAKVFRLAKDLMSLFRLTNNRLIADYHKLPYNTIFIDNLIELDGVHHMGILLSHIDDKLWFSSISRPKKIIHDDNMNTAINNVNLTEYPKGEKAVFVANILDYIHNPTVIKRMRPKDKQSKEWDGKPIHTVRKTDKVIRYLKASKFKGNKYSHSFYVHGHWRHFESERYINMRGKRKWIAPYIKGEGKLIEKDYLLT